jgi:soluble lytic murein transglycosylase-like protein
MPLPSSTPRRGGCFGSTFSLLVVLALITIVVLLFIAPGSPFRPNLTNPFVTPAPHHHSNKPDVRVYSQATAYYVSLARQDAVAAGISSDLFVRQINEESGFNPNVVSAAGAIGIAQFMPATAAGLGINPRDPIQSLRSAALLMARYVHAFGSYSKALAAYNAGSTRLRGALAACGVNWLTCLPTETQTYIHSILG